MVFPKTHFRHQSGRHWPDSDDTLGFESWSPGAHFGPVPGPWGTQKSPEKIQNTFCFFYFWSQLFKPVNTGRLQKHWFFRNGRLPPIGPPLAGVARHFGVRRLASGAALWAHSGPLEGPTAADLRRCNIPVANSLELCRRGSSKGPGSAEGAKQRKNTEKTQNPMIFKTR